MAVAGIADHLAACDLADHLVLRDVQPSVHRRAGNVES
jgi:hypothetical protein